MPFKYFVNDASIRDIRARVIILIIVIYRYTDILVSDICKYLERYIDYMEILIRQLSCFLDMIFWRISLKYCLNIKEESI